MVQKKTLTVSLLLKFVQTSFSRFIFGGVYCCEHSKQQTNFTQIPVWFSTFVIGTLCLTFVWISNTADHVTLAQACAFSSVSFCKFNKPQNRLDSSCWKPSVLAEYNLYCFATVLLKIIIKELFDFFFFQSINALNHCWLHIMRKEWHKVTYTPHHKLSWFSLICDKQTELSECA